MDGRLVSDRCYDSGMRKKIIATIEARMNSTRLADKVMLTILGKPMLEQMIERVKRAKLVDEIVVATTVNPSDLPLVELSKKLHVGWFCGSEEDVLQRVLLAAQKYRGEVIVELTGDCPLVDSKQIDEGVGVFLKGKYDYAANDNIVQTVPRGFDVQVFPTSVLKRVSQLTSDPYDHEHVSLYIYEHPKQFRLKVFGPSGKQRQRNVRLTVDTQKDLELIRRIFRLLLVKKPDFGYEDVMDLLRQYPWLLKINSGVDQKTARYTGEDKDRLRKKLAAGIFSYSPRFRSAIIGCGRIASEFDSDPKRRVVSSHAGAYQTHPDVQLVAACDIDVTKRDAFRNRWGEVNLYENAQELFSREHVDIVSITTKNDQHFEMAMLAIEARVKAIFCEKPFTDSPTKAAIVVKECRKRNVELLVDYNRRFDPMHQRVQKWRNSTKLGSCLGGIVYYSNGLINAGSHAIDLVRYFCGEPNAVWTVASGGSREDPDLDLIVYLNSGGRVFVKGIDANQYYQFELDALYQRGRVQILRQGVAARGYGVVDHPGISGIRQLSKKPNVFSGGKYTTLPEAIYHIIGVLDKKEKPLSTGENALGVLDVLAAAHHSLTIGRKVSLPFGKDMVLSSTIRSK